MAFEIDIELSPSTYNIDLVVPFVEIGSGAEWGSITGTLSDQEDLQAEFDAKQDKYTTASITIAVADWSGGTTVTKTVEGVTATSFNSICADKSNSDLLGEFGVIGDSQAVNEITFKADETPTSDIVLTVVIFK